MKITVCGSMAFSQEMIDAKKLLEESEYEVVLPEGVEKYCRAEVGPSRADWTPLEGAQRKIDNDLIRKYYAKIAESDAILVINKDKNGIKNYIGGNSFLEMGFAHILNKKIYTLNPLPEEQQAIYQELVAFQPVTAKGDLKQIIFEV